MLCSIMKQIVRMSCLLLRDPEFNSIVEAITNGRNWSLNKEISFCPFQLRVCIWPTLYALSFFCVISCFNICYCRRSWMSLISLAVPSKDLVAAFISGCFVKLLRYYIYPWVIIFFVRYVVIIFVHWIFSFSFSRNSEELLFNPFSFCTNNAVYSVCNNNLQLDENILRRLTL